MMQINRKGLYEPEIAKENEFKKGTWIDLTAPTEKELKEVSAKLKVPDDMLRSALDPEERARVEIEDGITQVIFKIPTESKKESGLVEIETIPLGIIILKNNIITVCLLPNKVLQDFYNKKVKFFAVGMYSRFLLQIFARTTRHYINYVNSIERNVDAIELELQRSFKNEEIVKLLGLQKSLVYFNYGITYNGNVLQKIMRGNILKLPEDDKDFLEDIIIENSQAIEMVKTSNDVLNNTMDAYASIISNNLSIVMKFLTSVTILLMIPTLVASIYGMNIKLPLQQDPLAFIITMVASFALAGIIAIIFWRKNWF